MGRGKATGEQRSPAVRRLFDVAVRPWAEANEFIVARPGEWVRPIAEDRELSFGVQLDKYGWRRNVGGQFTLNFLIQEAVARSSPRPLKLPPIVNPRPPHERVGFLFEDDEFEALDRLQNGALRKVNHAELSEEDRDLWTRPSRTTYRNDFWFHYVDRSDVEAWSQFLAGRLPDLVERFVLGLHADRRAPPETDALALQGVGVKAGPITTLVVPRSAVGVLCSLLRGLSARRVVLGDQLQLVLEPTPPANHLRWDHKYFTLDPTTRLTLHPGPTQVNELVRLLESGSSSPAVVTEASKLSLLVV